MKKIKLGNKVRDKVSGLEGIATCKCIYLNGCVQFDVQQRVNDKGEIPKGRWIDMDQLEFIDHGLVKEIEIEEPPGGGQRDHPNE